MTLLFISTYILAAISQYLYNQRKVELLANANVIANVVSDYMENDQERIRLAISRLNLDDTTVKLLLFMIQTATVISVAKYL